MRVIEQLKDKRAAKDFPVICVGGSAGGLDSYIRLLKNLPADMGAAIVIVNHLRTVATHAPRCHHGIASCPWILRRIYQPAASAS